MKFETWRTTLQEAETVYAKMPPAFGTETEIEIATRKKAREITSGEAESKTQAQSVKTPVHHLSLLPLLPHQQHPHPT